jgi:integrase/recombinase XerD
MRELREPSGAEEIEVFETDVLAGFVLARASAGLADSTIRNDTGHLDLIRNWLGRPLWEMQPEDADAYFGRVLRDAKPSTRTGRAAALAVYFQFLELRHRAEIYNLTGRVVECPLDEMNRPRASVDPQLRVPPAEAEVERLFAGWREELASCRKFARPPGTTRPPGRRPTSACGSVRSACSTWTACAGSWAGSAS